jgi:hypothetical protein
MKTNSHKALRRRRFIKVCANLLSMMVVFLPVTVLAQVPRPDHIVIVVEENRDFEQIDDFINDHPESYLAELKKRGAYFTAFHAAYHPSQPNYILMFAGKTYGIMDDEKPPAVLSPLVAPSLGGELLKKDLTFTGYAEGLPKSGFNDPTGCIIVPKNPETPNDGQTKKTCNYARKHCPWTNFGDVPTFRSLPFSAFPPPADFDKLPTVSMVIPDLRNDMHGMTAPEKVSTLVNRKLVKRGDAWLRTNLEAYAQWAMTHNSLLIVTWDESQNFKCALTHKKKYCETHPPKNQIVTIFVGSMVQAEKISNVQYTHLDLLRTIEEMYGLPLLGDTGNSEVRAISDIWK